MPEAYRPVVTQRNITVARVGRYLDENSMNPPSKSLTLQNRTPVTIGMLANSRLSEVSKLNFFLLILNMRARGESMARERQTPRPAYTSAHASFQQQLQWVCPDEVMS